jgi:hypothetical protein
MKKKRLARIIAIVVGLLIGIPLVIFGFLMTQGAFTRASNAAPENVRISQVTSTTAVITWNTGEETQGVVQYGTSPTQLTFFAPENRQTTVHRSELSLLKPQTTYFFNIRVGETIFDNGGSPWTFTTKSEDQQQQGTDSASLDGTPVPSGSPVDDDLDIDIDFDDDDSIVYVISPTRRPTQVPVGPGSTIPSSVPTSTPRVLASPTSAAPRPSNTPASSCPTTTNCQTILANIGRGCSSADYIKCLKSGGTYATPTPSRTPTPSVMVPGNPSDLSASASGSMVTLTWTDNSVGETSFRIFRSTNADNGFSQVGVKLIEDDPGSGQGVSIQLNSQPSGTLYYRVYSYVNETRSQGPSNTASITIP